MPKLGRLYEILKDPAGVYVLDFVIEASSLLPANAKVLDAGAGQCQYKSYFSHCHYVSVDNEVGDKAWDYSHLDIRAPLDDLPLTNNSFDAVLCTEVLEHLSQPLACLKELYRVLKPDGTLYLSAPFFHFEHQAPYDFFRYTSYGLKYLLKEAGFKETDVSVESTGGGIFLRWAYELTSLFTLFPSLRIQRKESLIRKLLFLPVQILFLVAVRSLQCALLLIDRFDKSKKAPFGWKVIAKKTL